MEKKIDPKDPTLMVGQCPHCKTDTVFKKLNTRIFFSAEFVINLRSSGRTVKYIGLKSQRLTHILIMFNPRINVLLDLYCLK
jgi:hypothetical protein